MKIALLDSFADTSHRQWAEGFRKYSNHNIDLILGDAHYWKWKMTGGTYELIDRLQSQSENYNLLLVTDMVNLPLLKSHLSPKLRNAPIAIYMHENQITYPWSPEDKDADLCRDHHYGWINYCSARLADKVFFNSAYHRTSFLDALPEFLSQFPKFNCRASVKQIGQKSDILHIGLELPLAKDKDYWQPVFIWNHRWEYDKNPELFFKILLQLSEDNFDFGLIVLGRSGKNVPDIFHVAKSKLTGHIIHWGWADRTQYEELLHQANVALVTSYQDFFGISVVESIAAGCYPILPRRLSYPEHIPDSLHTGHFYKSQKEIIPIIKKLDQDKWAIVKRLSQYIQKYSWKNMINQYDQEMGNIIK